MNRRGFFSLVSLGALARGCRLEPQPATFTVSDAGRLDLAPIASTGAVVIDHDGPHLSVSDPDRIFFAFKDALDRASRGG